jgi:hypothetical protein
MPVEESLYVIEAVELLERHLGELDTEIELLQSVADRLAQQSPRPDPKRPAPAAPRSRRARPRRYSTIPA